MKFLVTHLPRLFKLQGVLVRFNIRKNEKYAHLGMFQYLQAALLTFGFATGSFLAYSIALLELFPQYICTNPTSGLDYSCTRDDFCGTNIKYRIDWRDDTSLHNWVESLNLTCTPKS